MSTDLDRLYAAIDSVNANDPTTIDWRGERMARSLLQGQRATWWLPQVADGPSAALSIAARAHHLARWTIGRASYPDGRAGYLRWRKALKLASAERLVTTLTPLGVTPSVLERAGELVQRVGLGTDPEAQAVEDVACLVFLETDFEPLLARLGPSRTTVALSRTLLKMSPAAVEAGAAAAPVGPARDLLTEVASS